MLDNPLSIISNIANFSEFQYSDINEQPCAIYISFRKRFHYLNELVGSLNWYNGKVITLASNYEEERRIDTTSHPQMSTITICDSFWMRELQNFKTISTTKYIGSVDDWDLPIKRNIALLDALEKNFNKILLIDDDIVDISPEKLRKGSVLLSKYAIVGCPVKEYPDTSVIGHIEIETGENYHAFISGNFLFLKPKKILSFFSTIYNEDWLFMIPSILNEDIAAFDSITQREYDPYDNDKRIPLQEFGEILIEGLFQLVSEKNFTNRYDQRFWEYYIEYRRSYVEALLELAPQKYRDLLQLSLSINSKITPIDCTNFISDWESDLVKYQKLKIYAQQSDKAKNN